MRLCDLVARYKSHTRPYMENCTVAGSRLVEMRMLTIIIIALRERALPVRHRIAP